MNLRTLTALFAMLVALCGASCAPAVRQASSEVPKAAVPAAADASLKVLEDPRARARVANVLGTPEVQRALAELSSGLSAGVVERLSSEQLADHMTVLVDRFTRAFIAALADDVKSLQPAAQQLAASISASVVKSASDEISRSLGPAMRDAMQKDVAPAMAALVRSPDFQSALGQAAHEVSKQAVYGSNEAMGALADQRKAIPNGPIGAVSNLFEKRAWLIALIAVSAIFAIPLVWLIRERAAARRYHDEAERRSAETRALVRALDEAKDGSVSRDVVAILKRQFEPATAPPIERSPRREAPPPPAPRHA